MSRGCTSSRCPAAVGAGTAAERLTIGGMGEAIAVVLLGGFIAGAIAWKRTERWLYVFLFTVLGAILPIIGAVLAAVWRVPPLERRS